MILYFVAILIGAAIGSFINVLAARTVARQSILMPPSFCDSCAKPLWHRDLIPVVSFFLLRARCRFCHIKLSWQYPLVEFGTAMLFFLAAIKHPQFDLYLIASWFSISVLVTLFLTDFRSMVLPDEITLSAIAILIVVDLVFFPVSSIGLFFALLLGGGFFAVQYFISGGRWVGSGDIRFGFLIGAITMQWFHTALAIMIAYVLGAAVVLPMVLTKKLKPTSQIPFGIFLAVGTIIELFFGGVIARFLNFW